MEKFRTIKSNVASLPLINVDTDMIIPKQFLKTIKRSGLGENLFHEMRFDRFGREIKGFVLNQKEFKKSQILVAKDNFGCGSSREHAPWAILDFGIRCIIAPSFADIFYSNCFKNGILPVVLRNEDVLNILDRAKDPQYLMEVDLENQTLKTEEKSYKFDVDPFKKKCLINGLDDIGLTMEKSEKIDQFESENRKLTPWLYQQN